MSGGRGPNRLVLGLAGILIAGYALLSHYVSILPGGGSWALAIALAPALALGLDLARRLWGALAVGPLSLLAAAAAWLAWPHLATHVSWVYFLQHVGINVALGLLFGTSLLPGRQPLCTFFATFVQPRMSSAVVAYTRQVTLAWTGFFVCVVSLSVLLFCLAPVEIWSAFANILTLPLVGLMFLAEYLVRRAVLPPEDQLGITSAFRGYQAARKARLGPGQAQDVQP